jgi:ornithine cyclodeaminase/alanine dehydrogenase
MSKTLLISQKEIARLVTMRDVLGFVEETLKELGEGKIIMPPKLSLNLGEDGKWPNYNGYMNAMPAYLGTLDVAGIKWAGGFWDNSKVGLPSISGMILLIDPRTGVFRSVMDGAYITALRTAATTAVGAKYLANNSSKTVGIFGAGTQSGFQLRALSEVFGLEEVRIFDIRKEAALKLVNDLQRETKAKLVAVDKPKEAAAGCDIVVTVTNAKDPFLKGEWIEEGAMVATLGSYQEACEEVATGANKIVVDDMEQAIHRGNLEPLFRQGLLNGDRIHAEIGEVVAGKKKGRENTEEIILFCPIGMGALDIATAHHVAILAERQNLGLWFSFA